MKKPSDKAISLIVSSYRSGGAEKMMIFLANGFYKRGYKVNLIVIRPIGPYKDLVDKGLNTIEGPNLVSIYLYIPWLIFHFIKLNSSRIISTQKHINIIVIISALLIFQKHKVVFREANPPSVSGNKNDFKSLVNYNLSKTLYSLVRKHVAISEQVKESMLSYYNIDYDRIKVIYSPVIPNNLSELKKEEIDLEWVDKDEKMILAAGRVSPVKDYLTLVEAFKKVSDLKKCKLIILGNCPDKEYFSLLREKIEEYELNNHIYFMGYVDNPYAYMAKADLFVLSSKWEGFGNVLVEALACGCPVVSTDCPGGPREILDNGKYGKLVPVGDSEEISKAILDSLEKPICQVDKETLIKRGYEFTQEKSTNKYLNYLGLND